MATIKALGVGSGLDLNSLLVQLENAEKSKLTPLAMQRQANTNKISAYGSIKSALTKLQDAAKVLNTPKTFTGHTSTLSGTGVTASSNQNAVAGEYSIKVSALAKAHNIATAGVADKAAALDGAGTLSIGIGSAAPVSIAVAQGSSLDQIRDSINGADAGVTASIVNTGDTATPYKLVIASTKTGSESAVKLAFSGSGDLPDLLSDAANGGSVTTVQSAQNASLTVNGIEVSGQTNTISEALQGVTLSISAVGEEQKLTIAQDSESIKKAVTEYVNAYNAFVKTSKTLTAHNDDPTLSGKLLGDGTLRSIQADLRGVMHTAEPGTFQAMVQFGVKLSPDGNLVVDDAKLTKAISENSPALSEFFVGSNGNKGFAGRMDTAIDLITRTEGKLDLANSTLNTLNKDLEKRYQTMEANIANVIARYETQFAKMDTMMAQMTSMMTYLSQQFDAMAAQTRSK